MNHFLIAFLNCIIDTLVWLLIRLIIINASIQVDLKFDLAKSFIFANTTPITKSVINFGYRAALIQISFHTNFRHHMPFFLLSSIHLLTHIDWIDKTFFFDRNCELILFVFADNNTIKKCFNLLLIC